MISYGIAKIRLSEPSIEETKTLMTLAGAFLIK